MNLDLYPFLKCLHILGIISWMAGLLYFYRLFVYHFEFGKNNESIHSLLSLMEKRLFRYITVPAMGVSVGAGLAMAYLNSTLFLQKWFLVKMVAVVFMIVNTFYGIIIIERFRIKKTNQYSSTKLRVMNEIPTLLMIVIVVMVIFRPF